MRPDLLSFLFSDAVVTTPGAELGEAVVKLFEAAAVNSPEIRVSDASELAAALKKLGVEHSLVETPFGFELRIADGAEYRRVLTALKDVEAVSVLGDMGYVVTASGEQSMLGEPAEFRINLYALSLPQPAKDSESQLDLETVAQVATLDARTPKTQPPLRTWESSLTAKKLAEKLLETTTAGSLAPVEGPGMGMVGAPALSSSHRSRIERIRALQKKRRRRP